MTSEESFFMVGTHSTVQKLAKRMPDTTVETTILDVSYVQTSGKPY